MDTNLLQTILPDNKDLALLGVTDWCEYSGTALLLYQAYLTTLLKQWLINQDAVRNFDILYYKDMIRTDISFNDGSIMYSSKDYDAAEYDSVTKACTYVLYNYTLRY